MDEMTYIAEYYYEPHQKCWCAEIKDEASNVDNYLYAPSERAIIIEIKDANKFIYNNQIIRITKTSFYKK